MTLRPPHVVSNSAAPVLSALSRTALVVLAALAAASSPRGARAQEAGADGGARDWHLEAGVATDFPVQLGARVGVEGPGRVRLSTSLGFLPSPYVHAINGVLTGLDAYGDAEADLIANTLSSSLVWRTHVGWRPLEGQGLYVDAGYGLVTLGGGASAAEVVAGLTGRDVPAGAGRIDITARSSLHMLDAEVGWRFPVGPSFVAWGALGGAFTLASSASLRPEATGNARVDAAVRQIAVDGENRLNDIYTSYVFTPVITVGAAYVFF